ncbi:MAG: universal stress protein [Hyphomicrobiales bacterium]
MKRILVAVDRSEPSLRAVDLAADVAGKYGASLLLVTAIRDVGRPDPGVEAYVRIEHIKDPPIALEIEGVRNELSAVRDRALAKGARDVSVDVVIGDAAEQILANAKDSQADLIVMGSRGHGRLAGLLLGSVAQKVVGLAPCPVLVVH